MLPRASSRRSGAWAQGRGALRADRAGTTRSTRSPIGGAASSPSGAARPSCPSRTAGTLGLVQYRAGHALFYALGASQLDRTICISTAYAGWMATVGTVTGNDSEQMVDSDLVVLWGINASYTHINSCRWSSRRGSAAPSSWASIPIARPPRGWPTASPAAAGHGRRPRSGHDARAHRRGAGGPRLHPAGYSRLRPRSPSTSSSTIRSEWPPSPGSARTAS